MAGIRVRRVGAAAASVALAFVGLVGSNASAVVTPQAEVGTSSEGRIAAVARWSQHRGISASSASGPTVAASEAGTGWASEADVPGDVDARADVTNVSARMQAGRIRFGLKLPTTPDPRIDPSWQLGASFAAWLVDTNFDGVADYDVFVFALPDSHFLAGVITNDGSSYLCNANASWVASRHTFSATVPARCLGNPIGIVFEGGSQYDSYPYDQNFDGIQDFAPDTSGLLIGTASGNPSLGGFVMTDGHGDLRSFGTSGAAPRVSSSAHFNGDIARNLAMTPDGGTGYLLDGYGGLHPIGVGQNAAAASTFGGGYWPGWDIARGVAITPTARGGYLLDGFGGLHSFGIGQARSIPKVIGGPYWSGWDIARGVATLPNGHGGFVLDGFGGMHWFSLGSSRVAPAIIGAPYWPGSDVARGIMISPDGTGGYVLDAVGALHPFGINGAPLPGANTAQFPARGGGVFPVNLSLPADAATPLVKISGQIENVVIDPQGAYAYATNVPNNRVEVISIATKQVVASIPVGSSPQGLDFSPDGKTLYVANSGGNNVSVVDVATRTETRKISIPSGFMNDRPFWVAVGNDGSLYVTTTFAGSGYGGNMMWVDPSNDQVTHVGITTERTHVAASGDRTKMLIVTADTSGGDTFMFDVATKALSPVKWLSTYIQYAALNGDGTVGLVGPGVFILDANLSVLGTTPGGAGVALNDAGTVGYAVQGTGVKVFDAVHFTKTGRIPIWDDAGGEYGRGANIALSADGSTLAVTTLHGVSIVST